MNCQCKAYPFPHRPLGGACDGSELWERVYREGWECGECVFGEHRAEAHPYGEGTAVEYLRNCLAPSCADCPVVESSSAGREVAA